jgi:hypothetical protein
VPAIEFIYDLTELQPLEDNFASLERIDGTNVRKVVTAFPINTPHFRNGKFMVPADLNTAGTVTFTAFGMARVAEVAKNIALRFDHIPLANNEAHDVAYTAVNSGDKAVSNTQNNITKMEWTALVSTLGWAANDLVYFRLSRQVPTVSDLTGDMLLEIFRINIPVT